MPWRLGLETRGNPLDLKYDSFDLEAGTVTICGLHARNYVSADRNGGDNSQSLKYSGRKLRSDSNYRTVPVPEFLFDEIGDPEISEIGEHSSEISRTGEEAPCALVHMEKSRRFPH